MQDEDLESTRSEGQMCIPQQDEHGMERGEVWWVNIEPSVEGEIRKQRPAIIVSNDAANRHLNRVQVVPLTSKIGHLYPSEAAVVVAGKQGRAHTDQLTTVSKQRMMNRAGSVSPAEMCQVEQAIRVQLDIRTK